MFRKCKISMLILVVLTILLNSFTKVSAHTVELDPESLITMPIIIVNGSGTIYISSSVTSYTLYYQSVQISSDVYAQIEQISEDGDTELAELKEELNTLSDEYDELKEIYETAYEEYQAGLSNTEISDTELAELKTAYEAALANLKSKSTEYNTKLAEYNAKVDEIEAAINELTPTYVESNWVIATDNKTSIDLSEFSGEQAFVVWAKLVTSDATYYDEAIYTMTGTKEEETNTTENTNETTNNEADTETNTATTNETDTGKDEEDNTMATTTIPQTGEKGVLAIALAIISLGTILYKKYSKCNIK